ncbi:hypothetical protein SLEP1_g22135 [Rubroshorea leprosula]|uniref:UCH catalytic domain-containing protein n=1 Tax=Rubroshorea leprosula TaxID=152421 RepID=A0AAV5J884_9ROSI|nr:hypothetical protein SLEP1_g22135 [Rubroshorea leprosula]
MVTMDAEESFLDRFLKTTASMNPFERGVYLENDREIKVSHSVAATAGETEGNFMSLMEGSQDQYHMVLPRQTAYCRRPSSSYNA